MVAGTGLAELVRDLVDGGQRDGVTSLQQRPRGHHAAPTVCWAGTGARPGLCPNAAQTTHLPPQAMALSPAPAWLGTCAHLPTGPAWPCHQGLPSCQPSAMKVSCCPRRGPRSPSQCHLGSPEPVGRARSPRPSGYPGAASPPGRGPRAPRAVPGSQDSWGRRGLSGLSSGPQHVCFLAFPAATLATDTRGMAWLSWDVRKRRLPQARPGPSVTGGPRGKATLGPAP